MNVPVCKLHILLDIVALENVQLIEMTCTHSYTVHWIVLRITNNMHGTQNRLNFCNGVWRVECGVWSVVCRRAASKVHTRRYNFVIAAITSDDL